MMLQSLLVKHYKLFLFVLSILIGAYALYSWGYSSAQQKYQSILEEQQAQIVLLELAEKQVEKEIVTVYKDRVKTVTQFRDRIIEVTPDVLSEESKQCSIGPGFIGLHNAAASLETVSESTSRVDAASTEARTAKE